MLDLESTIKHYEKVAENQIACANRIDELHCDSTTTRYMAEHHRQLAEWLRELKKLREIPNKLVPKYRDGIPDEYNRGANEMLEEVIDDIRKYMEEVKADDT